MLCLDGAAIAPPVSIAVYQTLLGAAFASLMASRQRLRFPPIAVPLGLFVLLTLIALALSTDPRAGVPQLVKLYVFLMLPVVFTAIPRVRDIRPLIFAWAMAASASGIWAFVQFWMKRLRPASVAGHRAEVLRLAG